MIYYNILYIYISHIPFIAHLNPCKGHVLMGRMTINRMVHNRCADRFFSLSTPERAGPTLSN